MNMISTGAFQTEVDASSKQQTIAGQFAAVWEKKNAKAARAGGVSLMALSLAACGSDDAATTTTTATTTATTTTTTTTTPAAGSYDLTPDTDVVTGGAGDDAIDGSRDIVGGTRFDTLDTGDTINGGAGTDTLTVELSGGTTVAPGSLAGIEVLNLQTLVANSFVNAVNSDALTTVVFNNGSAAAQVSNVQTLLSDIDVTNNNGNAVTLTYLNTAAAGTADALDIDLSGFTSAALSVTAAGGAGGYETITLSSGGSSANTISTITVDAETTKIVVDGAKGLTVTNAIAQNVLTFDASAATGAISLETADADSTVTFTGGSGNDTFDIAGAAGALSMASTLDDVLDGGAGTDTLIVDDGDVSGLTATTAFTAISNFETLQIETALGASASVRLDRVQAGLTSLDVEAAAAGALTIGSDADVNVEFKAELSNGAITIDHTSATSTTDALTIDFDRGAADTLGGTLAVTDYETVTMVIPDGALTTSGAGITLTPTTGGTATLNITGDSNLIMAASDIITADVIDASGLVMANVTDAGVTMTTETAEAASIGVTITGSNGVDVIFATAAADVLSGGSGADTIHALGGQDNITLGAGADDYVIATNTTVAKVSASRDLVTDFVAGDSGDAVDYNGATANVTTLSGTATYGNGDSIQTVGTQNSTLTVNAVAKVVNITATDVTTFSTNGDSVLDALVNGSGSGTITMTSGDVALFMISNGTDSALYLGDSDTNAALVTGEIALIATFTGVDNADITAANFM
jgi:hypothetical protein